MNIRVQLERKIEAKKQDIADLELKLRECQAFLQGLQEALKVLPRDGSEESQRTLREGSNMAKVRDFLKQAGKPMHIKEILKGIGKENDRNNRSSVGASLSSYAKQGEVFIKTASGTFGLIEFKQKEALLNPDDLDLPENFGLEEQK